MNVDNIIIFTDLDGSLLNHDDFQFKKILINWKTFNV